MKCSHRPIKVFHISKPLELYPNFEFSNSDGNVLVDKIFQFTKIEKKSSKNYHPVSLLPMFGKFFEGMIFNSLDEIH